MQTIDRTELVSMLEALCESEVRLCTTARFSTATLAYQGAWCCNIRDGTAIFSDLMLIILGYSRHEIPETCESFSDLIHPDDLSYYQETLNSYLTGEIDRYAVALLLRHKDGNYKLFLCKGVISVRDPCGNPLYMVGTSKAYV